MIKISPEPGRGSSSAALRAQDPSKPRRQNPHFSRCQENIWRFVSDFHLLKLYRQSSISPCQAFHVFPFIHSLTFPSKPAFGSTFQRSWGAGCQVRVSSASPPIPGSVCWAGDQQEQVGNQPQRWFLPNARRIWGGSWIWGKGCAPGSGWICHPRDHLRLSLTPPGHWKWANLSLVIPDRFFK